MPLTPSERSQRARLAVLTSHARETDPIGRTAPARQAFIDRFARQVDPEGVLPEVERARRAEYAMKAYFAGLALKSAVTRRKRAAAKAAAEVWADEERREAVKVKKAAKAAALDAPAPTTGVRRKDRAK